MAGVFLALLLGGVGSIQVRFPDEGWVYTVRALQDGVVRRERIVAGNRGQVLLEGLPDGLYDVHASAVKAGEHAVIAIVRNVAAVPGGPARTPDLTLELDLEGGAVWTSSGSQPRPLEPEAGLSVRGRVFADDGRAVVGAQVWRMCAF